ncbi:uncharacterized protein LOC126893902 isoform X2 [Daktulosphaira vitifoliae]|uniref:uncharacterized protein LOC126893902 isoform X2 n=1 Tax=Daktulosphaira vitifoliae TaxID=58002 RepID=UPI0021AA9B95|nr:uncharacterized protein LOC126893902 isoform X2 [Daktulosphaira vitifoliae]
MKFHSLILMSLFVFVFKPGDADQSLKYRQDYRNYIKTVTNYIRAHIGSNEIRNLKLIRDINSTISIKEAFKPDLYLIDFTNNYSYIISILNFKYTEILNKFLEYTHIVIDKCQQFQDKNVSENFICCVTSIIEEVKNSKTMFENLYNAMKFLSYLDVRYVFVGSIVTNVIIDEIDFFQQYVLQEISEAKPFDLNNLPNLEDSETKFKNLNEFYTEATEKVNKLFKNSNIIDTSIKTDKTIELKECFYENDSYLVYLTCSKLNSFYNETIEIWYKNLGFEQFLNPIIPELMPPIDPALNQSVAIEALNIIRQETGWKTMDHIYIIYNERGSV